MRVIYTQNKETISFELYPQNNREYRLLEKLGKKNSVFVGTKVKLAFWMFPELRSWCNEKGISKIRMEVFNEIDRSKDWIPLEKQRIVLAYTK